MRRLFSVPWLVLAGWVGVSCTSTQDLGQNVEGGASGADAAGVGDAASMDGTLGEGATTESPDSGSGAFLDGASTDATQDQGAPFMDAPVDSSLADAAFAN